jgi:hypothetical protein
MEHIDGYLTFKIRRIHPDAQVLKTVTGGNPPTETWVIRRPGVDDVGIGPFFKAAKATINALIVGKRQEDAKR